MTEVQVVNRDGEQVPSTRQDDRAGLGRPDAGLDDRYTERSGTAIVSGVQALVRLVLEQRWEDRRRGRDVGLYVSGYQGSPLGTLDLEFARAHRHVTEAGIVFRPGVNEELAATAVAGTQMLGLLPGRRHDGVTGFWYGKNPGLDRAADAIRHGNLSGTAPLGGAVAWIGDDPASKSSSVPSACEATCRSLLVPVLAPGNVADVIRLGLHAVAMSRHAGVWTALKIVTDVADASQSVELGPAGWELPEFPARDAFSPPVMLPPTNLDAEADLLESRLARALEYARLADLNTVTADSSRPRLAVVASGFSHEAVVRALDDLGLDASHTDALGVRVVRLSMPWPVDRDVIRQLCEGVETVLVVEDKTPFVETLVRDALYGTRRPPSVVGRRDEADRPLLPSRSFVDADDVSRALGRLLPADELPESARRRLDRLRVATPVPTGSLPRRTPYFCSGCPHSISTAAEPDQLVGGGIGCHTMVLLDDPGRRGKLLGLTQMGGEGAQWIGLAPFTDDAHITQNIGDGTFHHSGSLALRAAVAAGVDITYKLLYNDAVAMTGGQHPEGRLAVDALTRLLDAEGVARTVVVTPEPDRYAAVTLAAGTEVRHRDDLRAVEQELKETPGVTVVVYDDRCATEKRRLRKRGVLPAPRERVWINERVCEGCGDCGDKATCLSLLPVPTEYGRKTQIQQSSCNVDLSCLKGDCPSFLLVTPSEEVPTGKTPPEPPRDLPAPQRCVADDVTVRLPGVGGTGVVTVSAIIQMAAHLDGGYAAGLEQIGLAQKGGPVISDVHLSLRPITGQLRASTGSVDVIIGLDILGAAAPDTLAVADAERTIAVLSTSVLPTAAMVKDVRAAPASLTVARKRLSAVTRSDRNVEVDAVALAEALFGDHLPANLIMVGATFQNGCLPISEEALEAAIRLNGAAVEANLAAFAWGRACVAAPDEVAQVLAGGAQDAVSTPVDDAVARSVDALTLPDELADRLARRASELVRYQDRRYAERYLAEVVAVLVTERERVGGTAVTSAVIDGLFKLMAYKDEYEVARLHLDARERHRLAGAFGAGARVKVLLHPPALRALGVKRKVKFGASAFALFRILRALRWLRRTRLDPFGRAEVRQTERMLVEEYIALVRRALAQLDGTNVGHVVRVAELPDLVRGYEDVKLANVARFRAQATELIDEIEPADLTSC